MAQAHWDPDPCVLVGAVEAAAVGELQVVRVQQRRSAVKRSPPVRSCLEPRLACLRSSRGIVAGACVAAPQVCFALVPVRRTVLVSVDHPHYTANRPLRQEIPRSRLQLEVCAIAA